MGTARSAREIDVRRGDGDLQFLLQHLHAIGDGELGERIAVKIEAHRCGVGADVDRRFTVDGEVRPIDDSFEIALEALHG